MTMAEADLELVTHIRVIQTELRDLDKDIERLSDEIRERQESIRGARDRVMALTCELHDLVSVPVRMGL